MFSNRSRKWALTRPLATVLILVSSSAQAAEDTKLEDLVRNAKVIKSSFPLTVERVQSEPDEVIVTTLLDPKAKPKDCKIDAMLAARSLIDGDKSVEKVLYRLKQHMADSEYDQILVRVADVKAFGMKAIDEQTLLSELDVIHRGPAPAARPSGDSTRSTTTAGGSATAHDTATTDGAATRAPLRQFFLHKLSDLKYGVSTDFGHRALSYAWLAGAASNLALLQKNGEQSPGSEQIFRKMESLTKNNNFGDAHRLGTDFVDALSKPVSPTGKPATGTGAHQVDYQRLHQHYYQLLQNVLGKDTPANGAYFVERTKPLIRLKELDADKVNTAPLYSIYHEAMAAFNRKDYATMNAKLADLSRIFGDKYSAH